MARRTQILEHDLCCYQASRCQQLFWSFQKCRRVQQGANFQGFCQLFKRTLNPCFTLFGAFSFEQGFVPFLVSATAGTTVYGAFDPLIAVADLCKKYKIWMHVDVSVSQGLPPKWPCMFSTWGWGNEICFSLSFSLLLKELIFKVWYFSSAFKNCEDKIAHNHYKQPEADYALVFPMW